jgi:hypothetical protein
MGATALLHHLRGAGLVLTLTPAGGLHVAPRCPSAPVPGVPAPGQCSLDRLALRCPPSRRVDGGRDQLRPGDDPAAVPRVQFLPSVRGHLLKEQTDGPTKQR